MIRGAIAVGLILGGVLLALWALYAIAFQTWLSATPQASGGEQAAAIRGALVGVIGLALIAGGVVLGVRACRKPRRPHDPPSDGGRLHRDTIQ
jgi:hypothetical protein